MQNKFTNWIKWEDRNNLNGINYPGIYCIAVSDKLLTEFNFIPELEYVGMTNSKGGLKSRLNQFDTTIKKKRTNHGGADRFLYKYQNYDAIKDSIYVAIQSFKCNTKNPLPQDLRIMGEITKCEYDCWAMYIENNGRFPKFNDKNNALKFSKIRT
ncbi:MULTISPECIES: hypothetical protein [Flavobacteriaceae]|uniref:GIY-YIG nuclease family protein n=2 Tax=Flavobacteriaceae TaxID=49546 RepID=A0A4Y8AVE2_9FLAO|nr:MULTISPECIES: hypothetical protein [Flavobacteriaceae]TEW76516.1 hypothetical protein E2488_01310 [Gramella jeungdoensis]GGK53635.1 hypothetical protein GCM10007963_22420 [Lutibacter litoralis]